VAKTQDDGTNFDPPPLSRFVEADSVGVPNGVNHHVGAGNESINNVDPSGSVRDATGNGAAAAWNAVIPRANAFRRISGILENASSKGNIHWRAYWNSCAYNHLAGRTRVKLRWLWFGVRALPLICTVHVNDIGPFAKDAKGKPQHPLRPDPDVVVDLTPHAFDILTSDKKPRRSVCHSHRP
jgi:hypothetical protein